MEKKKKKTVRTHIVLEPVVCLMERRAVSLSACHCKLDHRVIW